MIKRSSKKFIDNLLKENPNWKVLDIGCGYTANDNATVICDVQDLSNFYKDRNFVVLGFPCNQFGGQEPGSHDEICQFTSETFGVDFPLMGKIEVKGENQSAIYEELTKVTGSDGYQGVIRWNFEKFLIDNQGNKTRFSSQSSVIDIIQ